MEGLPSRIAQFQRKNIANKLEQHFAVRLVHNCVLCHGLAVVVWLVEVLPFESLDDCVRQLRLEMDGFHCCPVKSRKESVGWHFRRNWGFGRWREERIKSAFSRKA